MAKPTSPMPMLILGGKGSGKTHLMRYFSYPLQKFRHADIVGGIREEGYVGIYLRCNGLNAKRFAGKGQDSDSWSTVFAYYMDLWLAQLVVETMRDALGASRLAAIEPAAASQIAELLDVPVTWSSPTLIGVLETLRSWQRELDVAVNNAAITRTLAATIKSSPSRLVFGIPRVFAGLVTELSDVQFVYLLDELENLSEDQQRYVNTLIRGREAPSSFKVGARLYGIRTFSTYSADEIIREGSEYERLLLDDHLRANRNYPAFARSLCARRLIEAGYFPAHDEKKKGVSDRLHSFFETQAKGSFFKEETATLVTKRSGEERPYFASLRRKLLTGMETGRAHGVHARSDVEAIIAALSISEYPLLEKTNVQLLYREWSAGRNIRLAADSIAQDSAASVAAQKPVGQLKRILSYFQGDLMAQLYSDFDQRPQYTGIETFIDMSRGVPQNLLVILKHIFQWASFNGESPFRGPPISRQSQRQGVAEAAQWFFRDADVLGEEGSNVQDAIRRLAQLFREIRFADKPAECSLSTFSANVAAVTPRTRQTLELAEKWSLLLPVRGGQRDRNTRRIDAKYQINSMLAPIWDLPISRRGAVALRPHEVDSIFDPDLAGDFDEVRKRRVARMTAPRFDATGPQTTEALPLFGND
jgi:hypothetical protein